MPTESRADRDERLAQYETPAFKAGLALVSLLNLRGLCAAMQQMYGGNAYSNHMMTETYIIEKHIRECQAELARTTNYQYTRGDQ